MTGQSIQSKAGMAELADAPDSKSGKDVRQLSSGSVLVRFFHRLRRLFASAFYSFRPQSQYSGRYSEAL